MFLSILYHARVTLSISKLPRLMSKLDTFFKRKYSFLNNLMSFYPFFKKILTLSEKIDIIEISLFAMRGGYAIPLYS